jgi:exo-beta-1,3-glucanase (GH17 family)
MATIHMLRRTLAFSLLTLAATTSAQTSSPSPEPARPPKDARHFPCEVDGQWIGNAVSYGPFRDGQAPRGARPSRAELAEDLALMRRHWRLLRLYAADDTAEALLALIQERRLGMKAMVGAWLAPERKPSPGTGDPAADNRRQVSRAIQLANTYPDVVVAISVGNETQVSWSSHRVAPEVLIGYIRQARRETTVPVTTADDYTFWLEPRSQPIASEVDFIVTHIYAMWRGEQLVDAVPFTRREYAAVKAAHPHHPVVIGEAGWATKKHTAGDQAKYIRGQPGEVEQKQFYDALLAWTTRERITNFYFEAFDEKWKGGPHPDEVEKHWGLYHSDRTPKLAIRARLGHVTDDWQQRVCGLSWICYNPSDSKPEQGQYAGPSSVRADLAALRAARFTGLITYACGPPTLRAVVPLAEEAGFEGLILGIWNPLDEAECAEARTLARQDIVLGLCAGNEGLGRRYRYEELVHAIDRLRSATRKPVTTTEEVKDYLEPRVLHLGDWVFPNAHPVYHGRNTLDPAIRWTVGAFKDVRHRAGRFVWFKEVGWPSGGGEAFTAVAQQSYYAALVEDNVTFAYFEAFDQNWKTWRACEPHFGLFDAERGPKPLVAAFQQAGAPTLRCVAGAGSHRPDAHPRPKIRKRLYIYREHGAADNHFTPTGREGDAGDVRVDEAWRKDVYRGETCLRIRMDAVGAGPNRCDYGPPCRWAGLRWLQPAHNWGRSGEFAGQGLDLRGFQRVVFRARAEAPCTVSFLVGGVDTAYGDSLAFPARTVCRLDERWREYSIDLSGGDLSHIIAGFGCATTWENNPAGVTLYLDEIYFE